MTATSILIVGSNFPSILLRAIECICGHIWAICILAQVPAMFLLLLQPKWLYVQLKLNKAAWYWPSKLFCYWVYYLWLHIYVSVWPRSCEWYNIIVVPVQLQHTVYLLTDMFNFNLLVNLQKQGCAQAQNSGGCKA